MIGGSARLGTGEGRSGHASQMAACSFEHACTEGLCRGELRKRAKGRERRLPAARDSPVQRASHSSFRSQLRTCAWYICTLFITLRIAEITLQIARMCAQPDVHAGTLPP